ncbi:unnamed protein product [Mycena citricolor]|uniref:Nitroreductase domain-containing protein n=1 Tax=Mycena citricolor TaxID=2018698 RepID=A0AAD2HUX6_9AGAR|nr:unnamed protein product [Mycena citricolor]
MATSFLSALTVRRTNYTITSKSPISDARIEEVIRECLLHTPSAWNSQSERATIVLGEQNKKLWAIVSEKTLPGMPEELKAIMKQRMDGFANSYGSVLFWEDQTVIDGLVQKFPLFGPVVPVLGHNSAGMLHGNVWTALALEGLAASLQHHGANPVLAAAIQAEFGLPKTWTSTAIMPFGVAAQPAGEKAFGPIEQRLKVIN